MSFARVFSAQNIGIEGETVTVETDLSRGLSSFTVVGLPDRSVEESKDRVSAALKNSGFPSPKQRNQKVVISLAPAGSRKEGALFDLSIALAYLLALKEVAFDPQGKLFVGELSLSGELCPVKGILPMVRHARKAGFTEFFVPQQNAAEAALVDGIHIYSAKTLREVVEHVDQKPHPNETSPQKRLLPHERRTHTLTPPSASVDMRDIVGQESAKRGLEIAAAGRHNIALFGPPGTGKTMLARAFSGILPPLSLDEALEVTGIHSVAGVLRETLVSIPPIRAPHHTASYVSLVGGGTVPRPGEITLAHRGVLFLDEFPEFDRRVIEALRQPLEDRVVTISRAKRTEIFPANFILIAAMNPCPCGNFGTEGKECVCTVTQLNQYQKKISGPILDRIDMWVEVGRVDLDKLSEPTRSGEGSEGIRSRVIAARERQRERFLEKNEAAVTNGDMSARDIERHASLRPDARGVLKHAATRLDLSGRAYHRVIKLARTIADLDDSEEILDRHILEAISYRRKITDAL